MRAGLLRHLLELQKPDTVTDNQGGAKPNPANPNGWILVDTVHGEIEAPGFGREGIEAGQVQSANTLAVTIRWRSDVKSSYRFVERLPEGDRILLISGATDPNGRRQKLVVICEEKR